MKQCTFVPCPSHTDSAFFFPPLGLACPTSLRPHRELDHLPQVSVALQLVPPVILLLRRHQLLVVLPGAVWQPRQKPRVHPDLVHRHALLGTGVQEAPQERAAAAADGLGGPTCSTTRVAIDAQESTLDALYPHGQIQRASRSVTSARPSIDGSSIETCTVHTGSIVYVYIPYTADVHVPYILYMCVCGSPGQGIQRDLESQ